MNDIERAIDGFKRMKIGLFNAKIDGEPIRPYLDIAISALEKQTAVKVDYTERNYSNLPVAKCPSCGNTTINDNRLLSSAKYCPDCGKRLDWEVEE